MPIRLSGFVKQLLALNKLEKDLAGRRRRRSSAGGASAEQGDSAVSLHTVPNAVPLATVARNLNLHYDLSKSTHRGAPALTSTLFSEDMVVDFVHSEHVRTPKACKGGDARRALLV